MNFLVVSQISERIGRLPDSAAKRAVTPRVLQGYEQLPEEKLERASLPMDDSSRWRAASTRELLDEAIQRFEKRPTASDAWVAPRLHHLLRMTRVEASESEIWNYLALRVAPDFVQWRWGKKISGSERVAVSQSVRFSGGWDLQCFSRLWWAAELFRDGKDYMPVVKACENQDVLNTVLRQEIVRHRPTAQALLSLSSTSGWGTGRGINALSKVVNAAGSTRQYEVIAPDEPRDADALLDWINDFENVILHRWESLPLGPNDGGVPKESTRTLIRLFEDLSAYAVVRGRKPDLEEI